MSQPSAFNAEDAIQLSVGSFILAVPVSFSEEAWSLGLTLPLQNLVLLVLLSWLFLGIYAHQSVFQGDVAGRVWVFLSRVFVAYMVAVLVVALVLASLDKLPVISDPITAIRRIIVISMPASMGGIIVDGLDKE